MLILFFLHKPRLNHGNLGRQLTRRQCDADCENPRNRKIANETEISFFNCIACRAYRRVTGQGSLCNKRNDNGLMSSQRMSFLNFQDSFTAVELLVSLIGLGLLVAGLLTTEQMKIISSTILFKLPFDNVSPTDIEGPSLFIGLLRTCSKINSNASTVCTPQRLVYPVYNISALSHANLNMTGGPSRYIRPPSLYPPLFIVISISFLSIFAFMNVAICLRRLRYRYLKFMGHRWIARIHNMFGLLSALISLPIFAYLYLHFLKIRLDFNDRVTLDDPPVYLYAVAGISNQLLWSGAAICVPSIISSLFHINLKRTAIVDSAMVPKRQRDGERPSPRIVSVPSPMIVSVPSPIVSVPSPKIVYVDSGDHSSSPISSINFATGPSNSQPTSSKIRRLLGL